MKLLSILIVLVIVAFLAVKQLDSSSSSNKAAEILGSENSAAIKAPTSVKDLQKFEDDMNKLMQDSTEKRRDAIEKSLGN